MKSEKDKDADYVQTGLQQQHGTLPRPSLTGSIAANQKNARPLFDGIRRPAQRRASMPSTSSKPSLHSSVSMKASSQQRRVGDTSLDSGDMMHRASRRRASMSSTGTKSSTSWGASSQQNRVGDHSPIREARHRPVQRRSSLSKNTSTETSPPNIKESRNRPAQRRSSLHDIPTKTSGPSAISMDASSQRRSKIGDKSLESKRTYLTDQHRSTVSKTSANQGEQQGAEAQRKIQKRRSSMPGITSTKPGRQGEQQGSDVHQKGKRRSSMPRVTWTKTDTSQGGQEQGADTHRKVQRRSSMPSNSHVSTPRADLQRHSTKRSSVIHTASVSSCRSTSSSHSQSKVNSGRAGERGPKDQRKASGNSHASSLSQSMETQPRATEARRPTKSDNKNYSSLQRRCVLAPETIELLLISES